MLTTAATTFGGLSRSELMSRVRSRGNESTELRLNAAAPPAIRMLLDKGRVARCRVEKAHKTWLGCRPK